MATLKEGDSLHAIFWTNDDAVPMEVGKHGCVSLTVFYENGQMSYVPWVRSVQENGRVQCWNVALLEGYQVEEAP